MNNKAGKRKCEVLRGLLCLSIVLHVSVSILSSFPSLTVFDTPLGNTFSLDALGPGSIEFSLLFIVSLMIPFTLAPSSYSTNIIKSLHP